MTNPDYTGLATLVGALGIFVTTTVTAVLQVVSIFQNNKRAAEGTKRDEKIAQVHDLVNGQSLKIERLAFAAGQQNEKDKQKEI